ncbi:MAG: hypothetical protein HGA53_06380 [Anaerolineaceae bacterium]|nr:hypothetical protein [Anaerolineaceae bacterium]
MNRGGRKLIFLVLLITIFAMVLTACGGGATEEPKLPTATYVRDTPVPVVVDDALFKEYFTEFGLGQLPAGAKAPDGIEKDKTEFTLGQDLCFYSVNVKQTKISYEIFDETTKNSVSPKTIYLNPLVVGNNGDCVNIDVGAGNFEFRVYVKSVVAKVIKFTVK